jgi:hypothetical protein
MLLNLHSRLAQRVLVQLFQAEYRNEQDLYRAASEVAWEIWFTPRQSIKVEVTAQHSPLNSLNFAALKIKDAVCDRFRARAGGVRPDVEHPVAGHPHLRASDHRHRVAVHRHLGRGAVQARLARGQGRGATEGDAGRGDDRGQRLGRTTRRCRCTTPAAAAAPSPSRRRRSPATSRPAACAALPSRRCCRSSPCLGGDLHDEALARQRCPRRAASRHLRQRCGAPHGRLRTAQCAARRRGRCHRVPRWRRTAAHAAV